MRIKKLKELNDYDLIIKWRCTYDCNYHCSYCYQDTHCIKNLPKLNYIEIAKKINDLITRNNKKKVKLLLIGGEVTLLPLLDIIDYIPSIDTLHITTNFSKEPEYYNKIKKKVKNIDLCLSFHHEYITVADFIEKIIKLNKDIHITVEMVENKENSSFNRKLIQELNQLSVPYIVDKDRREINTNERNKSFASKAKNRIQVVLENGKVKYYQNKNDIYFDEDINSRKGKAIETKGLCCSEGYDYLYIKGDKIFNMCNADLTSLEDWKPKYKRCEKNVCTLCGFINLCE